MPSIYSIKPQFQQLLRPLVKRMADGGVTANQVTVAACALSIGLGCYLSLPHTPARAFLALPGFLFVRMALNAIDGMLAREFGHKSSLGAYLNELTDVVADAFLYLPFAYLPDFNPLWIGVVIVLSVVSEMAGVIGVMVGGARHYEGPMGKSDRAFWFGAMALWIGLGLAVEPHIAEMFPVLLAGALALTIRNRVIAGLKEVR